MTLDELVQALYGMGYDRWKVHNILKGEGFHPASIAEALVPPRTVNERVTRLREAGASLRLIEGCTGVPKSTLSLMLSPTARENHNKRAHGSVYEMKEEQITAVLMALGALTRAIEGQQLEPLFGMLCEALDDLATAVDDAAERIESPLRSVALKLDAANKFAKTGR